MDDDRLVIAVQSRSALYDKTHPKHKSKDSLRQLWEEVAKEVGSHEVERVKKRWGYLRDYFLKQYKVARRETPGHMMTRKRKWPLFDSMSFLVPHVRGEVWGNFQEQFESPRVKTAGEGTSCEMEKQIEETCTRATNDPNNEAGVAQEEASFTKGLFEDPAFRSSPRGSKRLFGGPQSSFDRQVLAALHQADAYDDDDLFFKSLKPMLGQLDSINKLTFRSEVQNILIRLLSASSPPSVRSVSSQTRNMLSLSTNDELQFTSPSINHTSELLLDFKSQDVTSDCET